MYFVGKKKRNYNNFRPTWTFTLVPVAFKDREKNLSKKDYKKKKQNFNIRIIVKLLEDIL